MANRSHSTVDLESALSVMQALIHEEAYPYPLDQDVAILSGRMRAVRDSFIWAPGQVIWDDPVFMQTGKGVSILYQKFHRKLETIENELLVESAYFVVTERGVREARMLHDKGVKIRVLTNSLASNDVLAAHAGYAQCREALIEAGVEMYELRPDSVSPTVVEKKRLPVVNPKPPCIPRPSS